MTPLDKTPSRISGMFDAIAPRYDLLNRVLSAGLDQRWRQRAVEALALPSGAAVLDLCTGTADLAIAIATRHRDASVAGVDFSGAMLGFGQKKLHGAELARRIRLVRGDAARIPLGDASCDAATIAFGIGTLLSQSGRSRSWRAFFVRARAWRSSSSASLASRASGPFTRGTSAICYLP